MIQLTQLGLASGVDLDALSKALFDEFEQAHTIRLPQLVHPRLMRMILDRTESGTWINKEHGKIGREVVLEDAVAYNLAHFAANTPEFLEFVRTITGCDAIMRYDGRVYRVIPGTDHYDSWHSDAAKEDNRLVGMSINLGPRPYLGGIFQLRRKDSEEILSELPNTNPGDAILFRISPEFVHRITPVEGTEPDRK